MPAYFVKRKGRQSMTILRYRNSRHENHSLPHHHHQTEPICPLNSAMPPPPSPLGPCWASKYITTWWIASSFEFVLFFCNIPLQIWHSYPLTHWGIAAKVTVSSFQGFDRDKRCRWDASVCGTILQNFIAFLHPFGELDVKSPVCFNWLKSWVQFRDKNFIIGQYFFGYFIKDRFRSSSL